MPRVAGVLGPHRYGRNSWQLSGARGHTTTGKWRTLFMTSIHQRTNYEIPDWRRGNQSMTTREEIRAEIVARRTELLDRVTLAEAALAKARRGIAMADVELMAHD